MEKINRELLISQLELVHAGISTREVIEQSSCFVFRDGYVYTFNDEIACAQKCCLNIEGAIPHAPLKAILQKLPEEDLKVGVVKGELQIQGARKRVGVRMESDILLPIDSFEQPEEWLPLPENFGDAVRMVGECVSKDQSQFSLTCIHIAPNWIEACDNFQIARMKLKTGFESSILVKRDSLKWISDMEMEEVAETETWIHFRNSNGLVISCRRYEEEYPELTAMLKVKGSEVKLSKGLADAADRASVFSIQDGNDTVIIVELLPGKIRIKGIGTHGRFQEALKSAYKGEPISFQISSDLLISIAKNHNECVISDGRLKIVVGKFEYVTCLGEVSD